MKFLSFLVLSLAFLVHVSGYPQKDIQRTSLESRKVAQFLNIKQNNDEDTDMLMEETEQNTKAIDVDTKEPVQESQTYFPSFSRLGNDPLPNSRSLYYQPDAAYSHRPTAYQQHLGFDSNARFSGYKSNTYEDRSDANSILGSGNFGVIKGGTFYGENDDDQYGYSNNYDSYYHNGHGRPAFHYSNRRPQQFENFRDFADINTPSYSEFVVVYANKNDTLKKETIVRQPKNIIERLAMLDLEQNTSTEADAEAESEAPPVKKLSKSKRKLAARLLEKKIITKPKIVHKDLYEPLLALS